MPEAPTVGELFKARSVTDQQVNALVDAVLAYQRDARAKLGDHFRVNVALALLADPRTFEVLRDPASPLRAKRFAVRTAILLARATTTKV
ncbi:hypothetical protein [Methylorubrum aminovorans]